MNELLSWVQWALLRDHGLRAGWRLGIHLLLAVVALIVALLMVAGAMLAWTGALGDQAPTLVMLSFQAIATFVVFVVLHVISAWFLDARFGGDKLFRIGTLTGAGLGGPFLRSFGELAVGVLIGALAILPALGIMAISGLEMAPAEVGVNLLVAFVGMSLVLVAAAAFEELAFRGYAFLWLGSSISRIITWLASFAGLTGAGTRKMADVVGFGVPAVAVSVIFGVAHASNPNATFLSSLNTVLAGLWLAVLILRTRSLWMAIGAHWAWNHFHGLVLGFPLSGISEDMPSLFQSRGVDPQWLGGGEYGVEGSIGATLSCVIMLVVCAIMPRRKAGAAIVAMVWPTSGATSPEPPATDR